MPCPLCGDICRCSSDPNVAPPRWLPDLEATSAISSHSAPELHEPALPLVDNPLDSAEDEAAAESSQAWRNEVAAKLNRYQARRKPRPPRYPSLQLRFEEPGPPATITHSSDTQFFTERTTVSNRALALDSFSDTATPPVESPASGSLPYPREAQNAAKSRHDDEAVEQL